MEKIYYKHLLRQGFELKEEIGTGLSGSTRKAIQNSLERPVAIKFFDSILNLKNDTLRKRFIRESKLLAELQHPSIPYVITNGEVHHDGRDTPYIVMQYISGKTLEQYIKENAPAPIDIVIHVSAQILDALAFVHDKRIIHRDIKPSNIMILSSGHCYLIDFSIGFKVNLDNDLARVTNTGDHLGTIQYMSPEQTSDMKNVDHRTDIYSYALVLCELLTGSPDLSSLDNAESKYPSTLKKVIGKALNFKADNRFSGAEDFLRELKQASSSPLLFLGKPRMAVCRNTMCPGADWSPKGYYRRPYFIEECTNAFCTSCGEKLKYQCENCSSSINTEFCGGCGTQLYSIPKCKLCGSLLMRIDMETDTKKEGCGKCRSKTQHNIPDQSNESQQTSFGDDDIPF